jgi:hypothetical protein
MIETNMKQIVNRRALLRSAAMGGAGLLLTSRLSRPGYAAPTAPPIPQVDGDWWQVAGSPDLGPATSDKQAPVDFAIWPALDGTWQIWSCVRKTNAPGKGRLLHRWEGNSLTDPSWTPMGVAMRAEPSLGETENGLQAPFVMKVGRGYKMFYGDWSNICVANSDDGKTFARQLNAKGLPAVFSEGPEINTRDPMILRIGNRYHCYYSAHPGGKGRVYCRTSTDLKKWGESTVVAMGPRPNVITCSAPRATSRATSGPTSTAHPTR